MSRNSRRLFLSTAALLLVSAAAHRAAEAQVFFPPDSPPFDFNDAYYRQNGIDPTKITVRVNGSAPVSTIDNVTSHADSRNNVRVLETTAGYDAAGGPLFYNIMAFVVPASFTSDAAGDHAKVLANRFHAFIFPKKAGLPLSPAPPNRRQDNLFDTTGGYLTVNPLGLWRIEFVSFSSAGLNTPAGQAALQVLAHRNGTDNDGTPVIKRLSEIQELQAQGFINVVERKDDGSQGFPWVV